jgi:hypothetical protein
VKNTLLNALWRSLDAELEPEISQIRELSQEVERQMFLAKVESDLQEQDSQSRERQDSSRHRNQVTSFISRSKKGQDEARKWQLQQEQIKTSKLIIRGTNDRLTQSLEQRKQKLLDSFSSYDPKREFIRACKRRYKDTSEWLTKTSEFDRWKGATNSSVFFLSGKSSCECIHTREFTLTLTQLDLEKRFLCLLSPIISDI